MNSLFQILIVIVSIVKSVGSAGDYDWRFQSCVQKCFKSQLCSTTSASVRTALVSWDCEETCVYTCVQSITRERALNGLDTLKYFGHWPFERWLGLEEPASAFFSLLNILPHVLYLIRPGYYLPGNYKLQNWISVYALLAVNAWLASACYHSKKTAFSTLYDLASALALLSYGLLLASVQLLESASKTRPLLAALAVVLFLLRFHAMLQGQISFDLHMKTCFALAGAGSLVWMAWMLRELQWGAGDARLTARALQRCLAVQLSFLLASLLEIFDFPPLWHTLDAHSLWHAATVPLGFLWYLFWSAQARRRV
jgi:hypothetical protein